MIHKLPEGVVWSLCISGLGAEVVSQAERDQSDYNNGSELSLEAAARLLFTWRGGVRRILVERSLVFDISRTVDKFFCSRHSNKRVFNIN